MAWCWWTSTPRMSGWCWRGCGGLWPARRPADLVAKMEVERLITGSANDPDAEEGGEYLVTVHAVNEQQTYSFKGNQYVLVKGKNPNPGL